MTPLVSSEQLRKLELRLRKMYEASGSGLHLGTPGHVAVLCVLLWFVARWTARNYAIGSTLITLLALFMSVPLTPDESPVELALDRGVATLIAGVIALVVLSVHRRVDCGLYSQLKGRVPELYRIGDCVAPRRAHAAIIEGEKAGRAV